MPFKMRFCAVALASFALLNLISATPSTYLQSDAAVFPQKTAATIVAVGGLSNAKHQLDSVDVIKVNEKGVNTTKPGALLPKARQQFAGALLDKTIYVMGGYGKDGDDAAQNFWSYDAGKDSWNKNVLPLPPVQAKGSAAAVLNGTIYVMGGSEFNARHVYAFDVAEKKWSKMKAANPETYSNPCLVAQNGALYYFARQHMYRSTDGAQSWQQVASASIDRDYVACAAFGKDGILLTGGHRGPALDMVEAYNTTTDRWTIVVAPLQTARFMHAAATMPNGKDVIVCGGDAGDPSNFIYVGLSSCEVYDSGADEWTLTNFTLSVDRAWFGLYVF